MTFLARVIRFLFWIVVVSWGFRLVGRLLSGLFPSPQAAPSSGPARDLDAKEGSRLLVRDPVCGVHIAEVLAIPLREDGQLLHFCSPACRDAYLSSSRTLAANG
jgi:YHS domain-containing protein